MVRKAKNRRRRWIVYFLLFLVCAGGLVGGYLYFKREAPLIVQTERVERRDVTELVVANGKIQPVVQVVINPEVSGEIIELPVTEGQAVKKGDLLLTIRPDNYIASRNVAEANYRSSIAGRELAEANFRKAQLEFERIEQLFQAGLVSQSDFLAAKTEYDVMRATLETSKHQVDQAKAALDRAEDDLEKTTIRSPMDGTVTNLKSRRGERVVGTAMMAGTEIMTIANLDDMEARVEVSEIDVVLIKNGQKAHLEVDAFVDKKFQGVVYEIANAAKTAAPGTPQEATKFEVKIRVLDKEAFRPGMSVTAEIETRKRTNVLCVPIQSVTTRLPDEAEKQKEKKKKKKEEEEGMVVDQVLAQKREREAVKPIEVVFLHEDGTAKMVPVKRGISDDSYVEITAGLKGGEEVIAGSYKAINRELQDGKKVKVEEPGEKKAGEST